MARKTTVPGDQLDRLKQPYTDQRDALERLRVEAVSGEPIELSAPEFERVVALERLFPLFAGRVVRTRLIAQVIEVSAETPALTVRQLLKLARAAGFARDRGCPRPEIIPLYRGRPVTAAITAFVTPERTVAALKAERWGEEGRPSWGSRRGTFLAWPTKDAAAQLIGRFTPR